MPPTDLLEAVLPLLDLPGVRDRADALRQEAGQLRFHEALRRRIPEAAAESRIRGAQASAALDGADFPVDVVRELVVGARPWPDEESVDLLTLRGAVQASAETERLARLVHVAPAQVLARLHVAAAATLVRGEALGRPRQGSEDCRELVELGPAPGPEEVAQRLAGIGRLVALASGPEGARSGLPAGVVVALVHAEIASVRPFVHGNGLVARAMDRVLMVGLGIDATAVAVPEAGHHRVGATGYVGALSGYAGGTAAGVGLWLTTALDAALGGVAEGVAVADSVRSGRFVGFAKDGR